MLEKDPGKRIRANQALEHIYLKEFDPNSEKEIEMDDEGMNMMERMRRLNEESAKFDMVRIN